MVHQYKLGEYNIVGNLVHRVYGAGANVKHDIVSAKLILMNHFILRIKNAAETAAFLCYLLLGALALLISDTAAGLASRLARSLALAASALLCALAKVTGLDSLDMLHNSTSKKIFL